MTTVFTNASFISHNEENDIFSVMVVRGREIVYLGYNTPLCYEDDKSVDLMGGYVIPLINDRVYYDSAHARCSVLKEGEQADFIVIDKNILTQKNPQILEVYIKGRKKV